MYFSFRWRAAEAWRRGWAGLVQRTAEERPGWPLSCQLRPGHRFLMAPPSLDNWANHEAAHSLPGTSERFQSWPEDIAVVFLSQKKNSYYWQKVCFTHLKENRTELHHLPAESFNTSRKSTDAYFHYVHQQGEKESIVKKGCIENWIFLLTLVISTFWIMSPFLEETKSSSYEAGSCSCFA